MPTNSKSILTDKRSMWIQVHCIINTNGHFPASALCMSASQISQQCNTYWGATMDFLAYAISEIESYKMYFF